MHPTTRGTAASEAPARRGLCPEKRRVIMSLRGPENQQQRWQAGGCPAGARQGSTSTRPGSAVAATGSAASALCMSLAASSPGPSSRPVPSARTYVGRRGFSAVGDWGPRTWNLRAERVGGKRRADLSPGASRSRGPAPRRPDPDRGGAGGGARGCSPRGRSPRGSRLLTPAVNSPGADAQRTFGKRRKLRSAGPLGLHGTLLPGCRLRALGSGPPASVPA